VPVLRLGELSWEAFRDLPKARLVAVLPVGATEAHGPHLPLATDVIIAEAMARNGAERLLAHDIDPVLLPPLAYTHASYAAGFAGTISIGAETATAMLVDVARALSKHGVRWLAIANAHLEPAHIASLSAAALRIESEALLSVVFPDVTRKPWALRLSDEFKSGACHAGRYEGSIVMFERPELVQDELRRALAPNRISLSKAIRDGKTSFEQAGGDRAYFGDPAAATAEEGKASVDTLGQILAEAVSEAFQQRRFHGA
jgi:creatinine amidohydrolase